MNDHQILAAVGIFLLLKNIAFVVAIEIDRRKAMKRTQEGIGGA